MQPIGMATNCPSCGNIIQEKFCSNCGEKKIDRHDFSVKHFAAESLEGLTHFDNKFIRSLKLLITRPGMLTKYHFEGRRVPYMKPLQLFIVCNIIFFFLLGKQNMFSQNFYNYRNFSPYTLFGTQKAIAAKAATEAALNQLAIYFNGQMAAQSKAFLILFIPLMAIFIALFFINKKRYFAEHLVFATHFFSFLVLYYLALYFFAQLPFWLITKSNFNSTFDLVVSILSLLVMSVYFVFAVKQFYDASNWQSILTGIFIAVVFTFSIYAYRMFLFYKILYSA